MSDDNDDIEESTPVAQVATAVAPMPTVGSNGRRKSGVRRKKKFLVSLRHLAHYPSVH